MYKYVYEGPVCMFGRCVSDKWRGVTYAVSEKKARSNLAYQFKRDSNLIGNSAPVNFTGELKCYEEGVRL